MYFLLLIGRQILYSFNEPEIGNVLKFTFYPQCISNSGKS